MSFGSFNLSAFSPRLMMALGYTIAALFLFAVFPLISGAGNTVFLEARSGGSCELVNGGTRFDKLALQKTVNNRVVSVDHTNWGSTTNSATAQDVLEITQTSGASTCQARVLESATADLNSATYYLPSGETVTIDLPEAAANVAVVPSTVATWVGPASMFQDQAGLVALVVGAIALIIGIGPLVVIGALGYTVLNIFRSNGGGMAMMLMAALGAVIVVSLLGTYVDFISITYDAIDADRFTVYTQNLASLAGTIRQFWGVIFVASFLGLGGLVAYQGYQKFGGGGKGATKSGETQMG